jgi:tetratricopeptide (TPR) repeat protein
LLMLQTRYDESIAEAERAPALDPAVAPAYYLLAIDSMNLGQFEKSLEYFDKAIRISPHDPGLYKLVCPDGGRQFRAEAVRSNDCMGPPGDHNQSE